MCICIYIYMYIHMYIYMYICIYIHIYMATCQEASWSIFVNGGDLGGDPGTQKLANAIYLYKITPAKHPNSKVKKQL